MIDLNGIKLKNRFLVSAGALGYGNGWPWERPLIKLGLIDPSVFGAVVTKTLTLEPSAGNFIDPFEFEKRSFLSHLWRISENKKVLKKVSNGWTNNMGLWNVGIDYWIKEIYPKLRNISIIPSIGGITTDHYIKLIGKINPLDIIAIELNISCPNVENSMEKDLSELIRIFGYCRAFSVHPLIVKIGINCDYLRVASIAKHCGINAISAINSVPVLGGGYSGPGIKYISLKVVSDIKEKIGLPVIGGGGIYSWRDCLDFFEVKSDAVSFGSVHFFQPWKPTLIVRLHGK